jgi:predicted MPP superfamily phosphohydrolase
MQCINCGSTETIKNGFSHLGKQRYKCKVCSLEVIPDEDLELITQNVQLAKQNQKIQDLNRIERKTFRDYARLENSFSEYIKELRTIFSEKKIPAVKVHQSKNPTTAIIQISDTHFNEIVDIVGNKYDFKIASKRLYNFAEKIILYLKANSIKNVYLVMTGDLMNSDRRVDELLSMATNRAKATFLSVKLLSQFIMDINKHANINIISVTGNESRIREESSHIDSLATDNFDFIIYEILKLLFKDNKSVNFVSGDSFEHIFNINNINVLAVHGDKLGQMKSPDISKTISKWSCKGFKVDLILCGHLHETKITDLLNRCGSLVGSNAYSDHGLNLYGRASQNLYIIYENGSRDSIRLDLQDVDDNNKMYEIDSDLEAYNAKSLSKVKKLNKL